MSKNSGHQMKVQIMNYTKILSAIAICLLASTATSAAEPKRLTAFAPNILLADTNELSVKIYDGVTDGCMKWPTGVQQTAEDGLRKAGFFKASSQRLLQIIASGYVEEGTNLCFVNIDLIVDELGDVYFNKGGQVYSAFVRFEIWKASFMVSGPREGMQAEILTRVGLAVEALEQDILRSRDLVKKEDNEYFDNFILPNIN